MSETKCLAGGCPVVLEMSIGSMGNLTVMSWPCARPPHDDQNHEARRLDNGELLAWIGEKPL